MDSSTKILVQGLLHIDYNQIFKKMSELQKAVDQRSIKIRLNIDSNAQQQLQGIQKQLDSAYRKTNSGLILPRGIDSAPIKQGTEAIKQQGEAIRNAAVSTGIFSNNISRSSLYMQEATKHTNSWASSIKNIITYYISFYTTINLFRQTIRTLKDMDTQLTEMSKVADITRNNFQGLGLEALEVASKYGRAVQDTLGAQTTFAKAGFENYKRMAELSLVTQSAGDMSEKLASSYLIASDKAFQYSGNIEKLTALLDSQNQVSNRHAITMEFLAEATQVAGNAMRLAGETEQTMTSALTAMGVATQKTGNEVGRAARTIEMRIQQVKQAFTGLDFEISVDGETEIVNATELSNAAKALHEIGIEVIKIENGSETFATMTEIATQLAEKLDEGTISATEMNKIVDALAGKHRAEYLLSLIYNIDEFNRAMQNFTNAQGSAMQEAMKQASSWEGRLNALKNTWTSFVASTLDSSMFIGILDSLNFVIAGFHSLSTVLLIVGGAFVALKLPSIIVWFQTLALQTKLLSMEVASAGGFFNLLKVAFTGTATSAGVAAAAMVSLQLAVSAAVAIISIGVIAWNHWVQAQEKAKNRVIELSRALDGQVSSINALKEKINDEATSREALIDLLSSHNSKYGEEISTLGDVNEMRERAIQLLDEEARLRAQEVIKETGSQYIEQKKFLDSTYVPIDKAPFFGTPTEVLDQLSQSLAVYQEKIANGIELNVLEKSGLQTLERAYSDTKKKIEEAASVVEAYEAAQAILAGTYKHVGDEANNATEATETAIRSNSDFTESIKELNTQLDNAQAALKTLLSAQEEYSQYNELSVDTVQALLALEAEYLDALIDENGQINLNSEAVANLINDKTAYLQALAAEQIATYAVTSLEELMAQASDDAGDSAQGAVAGIENAASAMIDMAGTAMTAAVASDSLKAALDRLAGEKGAEGIDLDAWKADVVNYAENLKVIIKETSSGIGGFAGNYSSGKSGGGGASKAIEEYIANIDKLYAANKKLEDIQEQNKRLQIELDLTDDLEEQISLMKEINSLYKDEQNSLHEINNIRDQMIQENVDRLREVGFDVAYDPVANKLFVSNMEHINDLTGDTQEKTNDLRKEYEKLIDETEKWNVENIKGSTEWLELQKSILDTNKKIQDNIKKIFDEYFSRIEKSVDKLLDDEKKLVEARRKTLQLQMTQTESIIALEEGRLSIANEIAQSQREINTILKVNKESYKYLDEEMRKTLLNEDDYKVLSDALSEINSQADTLYNDYMRKISSLTEDQTLEANYLIKAYERQNSLLMAQYTIKLKELDLEKERMNLANVESERSLRMFIGGETGFAWVADPQAVKEALERVGEAEDAVLKAKQDLQDEELIQQQERILDSLKREEESMDATFKALEDQWAETIEYIKELHEPTEEINKILGEIATVQTPELQDIISKTSTAVKQFLNALGYTAPSSSGTSGTVSNPIYGSTTAKSTGSGGYDSGSTISTEKYLQNKVDWVNASTEEKDRLNKENQAYRDANGIKEDTITSKEAEERLKTGKYEFKTGGVVDYTGPAWVDGTKSSPEMMLNNADVGKVYKLIHESDVLGEELSESAGEIKEAASQFRLVTSDDLINQFGVDISKVISENLMLNRPVQSLMPDYMQNFMQSNVITNNSNQQVQNFYANINGIIKETSGDTTLSQLVEALQRQVPLRN